MNDAEREKNFYESLNMLMIQAEMIGRDNIFWKLVSAASIFYDPSDYHAKAIYRWLRENR